MSILIHMNKPKDCGKCFVGDRTMCKQGCPLIELPPHGRLGDLDALAAKDNADYEDAMAIIADVSTRSMVCQLHYGAQKMIRDAPTIIPESGGNENE